MLSSLTNFVVNLCIICLSNENTNGALFVPLCSYTRVKQGSHKVSKSNQSDTYQYLPQQAPTDDSEIKVTVIGVAEEEACSDVAQHMCRCVNARPYFIRLLLR